VDNVDNNVNVPYNNELRMSLIYENLSVKVQLHCPTRRVVVRVVFG
jgi:hypothetical protein